MTKLNVHPLLGKGLINKLPQRQILGKESVARPRNNLGSCVFRVRGDVTTVDSDHVTCFSVYPTDGPIDWLDIDHVICVYYRSMSVPRLYKWSSYKLRINAAEAREQVRKEKFVVEEELEVGLGRLYLCVIFGMCDSVRPLWFPCYKPLKTSADSNLL
jgi:hypothetical protein